MHGPRLILHNWRCFGTQELHLPSESAIILDQNGSGKTSIVAALYSLHSGRPWPGTSMRDNLKFASDYFGILTEDIDWSLTGKINQSGKLVTKWQRPKEGKTPWQNRFLESSIITYLPSDNFWLKQSRTQKLRTLDQLLMQIFPDQMQRSLEKLEILVKSKQNLLKYIADNSSSENRAFLRNFSLQILETSLIIWDFRQQFFNFLSQHFSEFGVWINSPLKTWQVKWYISDTYGKRVERKQIDVDIPAFHLNLQTLENREIAAQKVLFGAQRDDFIIESHHYQAQNVLSRGEIRLLVLFIKSIASKLYSKPIVWFLDDVFNELDDERELTLFSQVLQNQWFLATSTQKTLIPVANFSLRDLTKPSF